MGQQVTFVVRVSLGWVEFKSVSLGWVDLILFATKAVEYTSHPDDLWSCEKRTVLI